MSPLEFLKRHRGLAVMAVFLAFFYGGLYSLHRAELSETSQPPADQSSRRMTREDIAAREAKFLAAIQKDPVVITAATLGFLVVLVTGIGVDAWLAVRRLKNKPWFSFEASHAPVPWGVAEVLTAFVFLFFIEAVLVFCEMTAAQFLDMRHVSQDLLLMSNSLVRDVVVAAAIMLIVTRQYGAKLADVGLTRERFWENVSVGLVGYAGVLPPLFLVLFATAIVAQAFQYQPPPQPVVEMYIRETGQKALVFFTVFVALLGPFMEELFFRGFAYKALRARYGVLNSMMVTSFFFSILHMSLVGFVPIFLLGMFLNYLYEKTGSLVPGMAAHMTHNLIMVGCTLAFKSLSS